MHIPNNHPMASVKQTLPVVDISPFRNPSSSPEALKSCAEAIAHACSTHGFFYLTHHSIPETLTDQVLSLARSFFTQRTATEKQAIKRRDAGKGFGDGARGYQVVGDNVTQGKRDWHEAIDWYRPIITEEGVTAPELENLEDLYYKSISAEYDHLQINGDHRQPPFPLLYGVNFWPEEPADFKRVFELYTEEMLELGTAVVRAMGYALELKDPETFVKATRESFWVMRAIGYAPLPQTSAEEGISCCSHTDYGCLTLLLADQTPGALQVLSRESTSSEEIWIPADPLPGAFVVNIGDMMERWTNGMWKSTRHRVVHRGENFRVSVPFFFEPDFDAKVKPLRECVGRTGGKELWSEVTYGEHLQQKVGGNFYGNGSEDGL